MRRFLLQTLLGIFVFSALQVPTVTHAETVLFGPAEYTTKWGGVFKPRQVFTAPAAGEGFIRLEKVTPGKKFRAGHIFLNRKHYFLKKFLRSSDDTYEISIKLAEKNRFLLALGGQKGAALRLTIVGQYGPEILSFASEPSTIQEGETTTLTWATQDADSVTINPDVGQVAVSGTATVTPQVTSTYTATATSPGGTTTAELTVTVINPPPTASLIASQTTISYGESTNLTWSSRYAQDCSIEPSIGSVPCTGETTITPMLNTNYKITAEGFGGVTSAQVSITVTPPNPITLAITSPLDGDTAYRPDVQVTGTINHDQDLETGIVVNGVVALVHDGIFVANHVPLQEELNTIIVRATDVNGDVKEESFGLIYDSSKHYVELRADTELGLAPLETTLRFDSSFPIAPSRDLQYQGPGNVDVLPTDAPDTWNIRITDPGIYNFTIDVQDETGRYYSNQVAILAMDRTALDEFLQAKWQGMKETLLAGDLEKSLAFFVTASQEKYRNIFTGLWDRLPNIYGNMSGIEMVSFGGGYAKYRINRVHVVNGMPTQITYYIYFRPDLDGQFKILKY